jgi:hypothetical protein
MLSLTLACGNSKASKGKKIKNFHHKSYRTAGDGFTLSPGLTVPKSALPGNLIYFGGAYSFTLHSMK